MPCHYQILPEENLVAKVYFGRVTTKCVLKLMDDFEADPKYREGMMEFDDLSRVEDLDISATDISHFAELLTGLSVRKRQTTRKAVLAPSGPGRVAAYGFSKLMIGNENIHVAVFDKLSSAAIFLEIKDHSNFKRSLKTEFHIN